MAGAGAVQVEANLQEQLIFTFYKTTRKTPRRRRGGGEVRAIRGESAGGHPLPAHFL